MDESNASLTGWSRFRKSSLSSKLVLLSTLLTVAAVSAAFLVLSFSLKRHTKQLLARTLAQHQTTLSTLQQRSLYELLRTSTLMTDSPTLRAAMETFASERTDPSSGVRHDLLTTIQTEARKVAAGLGRDLLVLTDANGEVLAESGSGPIPKVGAALTKYPIVRNVLVQNQPIGPDNFAVLDFGGTKARVGCVPIVLQGFIIGTLIVGDWINEDFARDLARSFDCDVIIVANDEVVATTFSRSATTDDLRAMILASPGKEDTPRVLRLAGEEYVSAEGTLGHDGRGHDVRLHLLASLTGQLADSNRYLLLSLLFCGVWAVIIAGTSAWWMSRSLLRPLDGFVRFMRAVASSKDHTKRFKMRAPSAEVETLNDAYNHLMESLLEHEKRLLESAREELSRMERLKESEKLAALGRTLSGAAHEINNPLTAVLGNVEMLLRNEQLASSTRERLELVHREGERIAALVRNVLKISRRQTGEKTVLDVHEVVRGTVEVRRHDFTMAGMRIDLDLAPEPVRVLGSEQELHQVFLNIINNAQDALKESGPFARLSVRVIVDGGRALLTFSDNGPGMVNPKQVFEHFYTTKPVGKGTGLGLGICQAIVQEHEGRITAENLAGGGARFSIELPLASEREVTDSSVPPLVALSPGDPLDATVLVVDDEPTIVDLQKEILESLGAVVVGVGSGAEAIEQLRQRDFDLIVSDVRMPGNVSGRDLFRWVKTNLRDASQGFVFITGDTSGDRSLNLAESLGARCMTKPFSTDEYVRLMQEVYHGVRHSR